MLRIRPVVANASWNVTSPRFAARAFWSLWTSIRCPVRMIRRSFRSRDPTGSKKSRRIAALIGSSPLNSSVSCSFVRVQTKAATMAPAELPLMILGIRPCSWSAFMTPRWYMPSVAPPERTSAVLPRACRHSEKKLSRCSSERYSSSTMMWRSRINSAWCSSIKLFVPTCVWRYRASVPHPPKFLTTQETRIRKMAASKRSLILAASSESAGSEASSSDSSRRSSVILIWIRMES
mmetsp:Transcript_51431/g.125405  ORF Transcript_51431/g.125405 Transcript_51431/m.125405 type:complete len:235 (-) Transcript_51431:164-868(-)